MSDISLFKTQNKSGAFESLGVLHSWRCFGSWANGDAVKVYYSVIKTRSIPPQIFGLAVITISED